jgi:peptide/nickel transport system permease protein
LAPVLANRVPKAPLPAEPSPARRHWQKFRKNPLALFGMAVLAGFMLIALLAPLIAQFPRGYSADLMLPPSGKYPFGSDDLGLSVFAEVIWGARVTMLVGAIASAVSLAIGVPLGLAAAFYRGRIDAVVSSLVDIFLSLPVLPLMILVAAVLGPSIYHVALVIGAFSWPQVARVVRSQGLATAAMPFTEAARALGGTDWHVLWRHLLPDAIPVIVVNLVLTLARAVLSEAGLSFLGLGDPEQWSWGKILQNAQRSGAFVTAWWQTLFPSVAILLLVIAATFVGTSLNEVMNPRLRGRR